MIQDCGFLEFPYLGDYLSWRGWRDKKPIRCRLDRALGTEEWHDQYLDTVTEYLPMIASDHKPLVVSIGAKRPRGRRCFMFDKRWIVTKLGNCRRAISQWRKEQVPYGRETIEDLKRKLEVAQADDSVGQEVLSDLTSRLREAYRDEEIYWYLKSRNRWMRVGDKNTKYFHAQTKQRRARNRIVGLYDRNNVWSTKDDDICKTAVSYFEDLFTSISPDSFEEALSEIEGVITEEINDRLTAPATEAEVRKVLFMMHPDKAPGPDGMTALFFQKAWGVVKADLVSTVNQFFEEGVFDRSLNRTNLCLIPMVAKPTRMTELRPISLCNVGYKIISKILCQRLKLVLPKLISETQSAFVPGRLILDNILIAQEMFHGLRTNPSCKGKFMAIKTDMSKAYDRVQWGFVEALLRKMGFSGDPLSPYLFILCTEVLIANIRKAEREKRITGIKVANKCLAITHLLFADDSLFFCRVDKDQCGVILDILKQYEAVSGQQINFDKSSIQFGHKVEEGVKREVQEVLGILNLGGMGSYLGILESLGGSKTKVFSYVRDRLQNRTNGWTAKQLSRGGKEVMIKSVATALWRLIEAPESLFARVFKGRYYRNSNPMDPICSYSPSYVWRSIVSARSLVNKGLIIRVGSGDSISIWTDPWIPAQSPRPAVSKGPLQDPSLKISHLIDRQSNFWRLDMLFEHFPPEEAVLIRAIPLGSSQTDDSLGWHFTKLGNQANLRWQGIACDSGCARCGADEETVNHAIFRCPPARQAWALAQVPVGEVSFPTTSIYANVDHFLGTDNPGAQVAAFPWIMWYIWKARNARVFENVVEKPEEVVRIAVGESTTWLQAQIEEEVEDQLGNSRVSTAREIGRARSLPTASSGYRCLVDGSWKLGDVYAGAGWVCSAAMDGSMIKGATNFCQSLSPLHAEVEAFVWAMRCMIGHDFREVAFYTDCSDLVKMVSSPQDWPAFKTYLDDIVLDREEFTSFSLSLIPRSVNVSADSLARQARTSPQHVLFVDSFPSHWLI
ncbi:PREDICTED: uncharacterized protein LOC104748899 [Camelina sativa]|uniref:Uncharacterized protein LOC104748899 n=1 Tax=Camelina sativa TaxID=90675 RepID=A0ABM0WBR8_CAMSA|nr:PREDICTED: uncharacterized protein LOC104748899 [Camelina sativa]